MDTNVMHVVLAESQAGQLTFPEVVRRLLDAGVNRTSATWLRHRRLFAPATAKLMWKK